jgi:hypothetical protein
MGQTTNYNFPTYEATDSPDLTNQYNAAVASIDTHIKSNETAAANASTAASNAQAAATRAQGEVDALETRVTALEGATGDFNPLETDKTLTVHQLAGAKVTANGIVYFKGE